MSTGWNFFFIVFFIIIPPFYSTLGPYLFRSFLVSNVSGMRIAVAIKPNAASVFKFIKLPLALPPLAIFIAVIR